MNNADFWASVRGIIAEGFTPDGLHKLDTYAEQFISGRLVYQRFSPREQYGCAAGGEANVIASLLAGAEDCADSDAAQALSDFQRECQRGAKQEAVIEKWAKAVSCWMERVDDSLQRSFGEEIAEGGEARNIFVMIAAIFSLVSCSSVEKDGDWDSMVWKAEVPVVITTDGIYDVSVDGGKFTFVCQNYSSPWIECATSGESRYYPPRETNDYHTITADWFKAEIVGNKLSVTFDSNKDYNVRSLELSVTAGDIFYTFKFKQTPPLQH